MVTEVVVISRKLGIKNESFTAFSVAIPVYSTRYVRSAPLLKKGAFQDICREVDVLPCSVTPRGTDGTVEAIERAYTSVAVASNYIHVVIHTHLPPLSAQSLLH